MPTELPPQQVIPLNDPAAAVSSGQRRWVESFVVSLIPFAAITVARLVYSGPSIGNFSSIELCFAMLSASAVLSVQLLDSSRTRGTADVMPALMFVLVFAVAFTSIAVAKTNQVDQDAGNLLSASRHASDVIKKAELYIGDTQLHPTSTDQLELKLELRRASESLARDAQVNDDHRSFSVDLVVVLLLAIGFLAFAIRVWKTI
jgi:hypothetical protein